jgi:hypothetical protein
MRQIVVLVGVTLWILISATVLVTDVQAPSLTSVRIGSIAFEPETTGLRLDASPGNCADPASTGVESACPRRYAFSPNGTLRTWVSVRNDGPLAVTLLGANSWIDRFREPSLLAEPVAVADAGNPIPEPRREMQVVPFGPISLSPGQERLVGVEFRTTSNVQDACMGWSVGTGIVFESVPIEWHWLVNTHTQDIAFPEPIEFMAPTDADCAG